MTIRGSCLCGGVRFEIERAVGPFEICHCHRCRKLSGAAGLPAVGVRASDYRLTAGGELIRTFEAPLLQTPPPYHSFFCRICGSPTPPLEPGGDFLEIPAGLLDGDPGIRPDKHIFVEYTAPWDAIADGLPEFDVRRLAKHRSGRGLPEDYVHRTHYDADET